MAARCRLGGPAPCVDDLCYSGHTLCALEEGFDFCEHGNLPDACAECDDWDATDEQWDADDYG